MNSTTEEIFKLKITNDKTTAKKAFGEFKKSKYSQNGEDGVIQEILNRLGDNVSDKFFVEFGGWDGLHLSNTANLRRHYDWKGILLEGNSAKVESMKDKSLNLYCEFLTSSNINEVFSKYNVPNEFGVLSIDIDSDDIYIFEAISEKYRPDLIVIECNPGLPNHVPIRIIEGKANVKNGYFNANLNDIYNVGISKGYEFVTTVAFNAFFVRQEIFSKLNIEKLNKEDVLLIHDRDNAKSFWENKIIQHNDTWVINSGKI